MLLADSVGRVRLKLIVRDFSDLQPREVITIFATLFGESHSHLSKKIGGDIFEADSAQNKRTTFLPKRELA